ncbi:hypothetical protein [Halapricum hydrolyticum]|uniref:Uncharacterized protein n=1 Tax=Halapricum hydrolyticum TaxID=2979991 RepID=A0AAE3IEH0_9EURY|nr:hypothetical protein [Halapricum hydrolyticum]MCU4717581.1 hypothetical protein [Halapricum hydrolyticum]MCU4726890.1 hypothetical protein [Halapricum hydrolyticum]
MTDDIYTYADGKSTKDLASYQGVRGAEVKAIATNVQGSTPISQVHQDFVRPADDSNTDSVDDTVQFLHAIDIIEKPSERVVEPIDDQPFSEYPFEIRVLHHLKQQQDAQDHFARIQEVMIEKEKDKEVRLYDKGNLKEDLEREADDYPFDWTVQKVEMWYNLMAPVGLISIKDNQEIGTSPCPALIYDLLKEFEREEGSNSIREALDWIEEHFFACYASRGGVPRVYLGLSDTMKTMIEDDVLALKTPSDATYQVRIPATKADQVSRFELSERPDKPAYRYPLEHDEVATL